MENVKSVSPASAWKTVAVTVGFAAGVAAAAWGGLECFKLAKDFIYKNYSIPNLSNPSVWGYRNSVGMETSMMTDAKPSAYTLQ